MVMCKHLMIEILLWGLFCFAINRSRKNTINYLLTYDIVSVLTTISNDWASAKLESIKEIEIFYMRDDEHLEVNISIEKS